MHRRSCDTANGIQPCRLCTCSIPSSLTVLEETLARYHGEWQYSAMKLSDRCACRSSMFPPQLLRLTSIAQVAGLHVTRRVSPYFVSFAVVTFLLVPAKSIKSLYICFSSNTSGDHSFLSRLPPNSLSICLSTTGYFLSSFYLSYYQPSLMAALIPKEEVATAMRDQLKALQLSHQPLLQATVMLLSNKATSPKQLPSSTTTTPPQCPSPPEEAAEPPPPPTTPAAPSSPALPPPAPAAENAA